MCFLFDYCRYAYIAKTWDTMQEEDALRVLFVCTGNICRSPTAERLAIAFANELQVGRFHASSAGIRAVIGQAMHPDAAIVLEELGGDSSDFTARQLTAPIAADADLILTMTRAHRDAVLERSPQKLRKTFTLAEASCLVSQYGAEKLTDLAALRPKLLRSEVADIADPIGQDFSVFAEIGATIARLLPPVVNICRSC